MELFFENEGLKQAWRRVFGSRYPPGVSGPIFLIFHVKALHNLSGALLEDVLTLSQTSSMNSNSMHSTFWLFYELFRDLSLLSRAQTEIAACILRSTPQNLEFDIPKLCNQPLLQSCYAETLRMRVAVYIVKRRQ